MEKEKYEKLIKKYKDLYDKNIRLKIIYKWIHKGII